MKVKRVLPEAMTMFVRPWERGRAEREREETAAGKGKRRARREGRGERGRGERGGECGREKGEKERKRE